MSLVKKTTFACAIALLFFGSVISVNELQRVRPQATLQDVLYMPSPKIVRNLSLGFGTFAAYIYWTRAVQYFGSHHIKGEMQYRLLYPLLEITTALDPKLLPAYEAGSIFLLGKP